MRPKNLVTFDDIIPISGLKNWNVDRVKERVREVLDLHAEMDKQKQKKNMEADIYPMKEKVPSYAW